ncbi:uncharacterized protein [Notamacropus eugenii]|uniref:uncharacterized protein n=1 Tax=Notamacropus eugenii TaxID=9315 RepID=UPI003B66B30D
MHLTPARTDRQTDRHAHTRRAHASGDSHTQTAGSVQEQEGGSTDWTDLANNVEGAGEGGGKRRSPPPALPPQLGVSARSPLPHRPQRLPRRLPAPARRAAVPPAGTRRDAEAVAAGPRGQARPGDSGRGPPRPLARPQAGLLPRLGGRRSLAPNAAAASTPSAPFPARGDGSGLGGLRGSEVRPWARLSSRQGLAGARRREHAPELSPPRLLPAPPLPETAAAPGACPGFRPRRAHAAAVSPTPLTTHTQHNTTHTHTHHTRTLTDSSAPPPQPQAARAASWFRPAPALLQPPSGAPATLRSPPPFPPCLVIARSVRCHPRGGYRRVTPLPSPASRSARPPSRVRGSGAPNEAFRAASHSERRACVDTRPRCQSDRITAGVEDADTGGRSEGVTERQRGRAGAFFFGEPSEMKGPHRWELQKGPDDRERRSWRGGGAGRRSQAHILPTPTPIPSYRATEATSLELASGFPGNLPEASVVTQFSETLGNPALLGNRVVEGEPHPLPFPSML